ncbi:hypothetical protein AGABI2DRAFT_123364 [Agaricus bisporus var. bisporus H97]|uniref:hypothetical protein n=1 Tax=Agaricus bisporus var. bisporus (strain H97 / ATCC MYA-4626 / FGSC 10389) TaxID=936046 RepID=UPI00029F7E15|nr:hypothetical protein AGABI2DRAFT_123364 [Agaricus bisporus var. bisporus H97]EKV41887.1 hypothetical protein AGABI2DRAFT_123364 [Agaricus bisporus var. bisporus H97]
MKVPHSILLLSLFTLRALSATITLYRIAEPTPTTATDLDPSMRFEGLSYTISPAGVGEDGRTTYIEVDRVSTEIVATLPTTTVTLSAPPPRTITITFEEDASGLLWQYSTRATLTSESTIVDRWDTQSCNFQGTTAGTCVGIAHFPSLEGNFTFTNSGTLIPIYTLTETSSIPVQTENSRALALSNVWDTYQLLGLVSSLSFMLVF